MSKLKLSKKQKEELEKFGANTWYVEYLYDQYAENFDKHIVDKLNYNVPELIYEMLRPTIMKDGGFNCESNTKGAIHSSMHSTISVLEGILEYANAGYTYRLNELHESADKSRAFLLQHRLFRSDRTGEVIDKKMLMLSYPSRWRYDILRALDYFQFAGIDYDPRMQDALDALMKKRRKDSRWPVQARHPGQTHFEMEKTGGPSRWNTLRAMRVLQHFDGTE